ncbi:Hypothetical protein RLITU_1602 [Romboutsia lituseburensis]|uniref:hypothetical protein n=1 Tax=Romboutsia lituseburensis TaxID=1537 RepID=UPI000E121931|nr:hypothetical protein [Romboutsia lituseburensis]CEH34192.1 Hypothetical protein RLITU_1602 [Romboutsia lituseburensis]
MKNKKDNDIEDIEYEILGNIFIGNLFDMTGDLDNTAQNLITYLEVEEMKKLKKKKNNIKIDYV